MKELLKNKKVIAGIIGAAATAICATILSNVIKGRKESLQEPDGSEETQEDE